MLPSPLTSVALATSLTSHWRRSDSLERMGRKTTGIGPRGLLVVSDAPAAQWCAGMYSTEGLVRVGCREGRTNSWTVIEASRVCTTTHRTD
jgi:hypothetical protein